MKNITKYLSWLLCAVLVVLCVIPHISAEENTNDYSDQGFVNVQDFGAVGTDKTDDYAAFKAALDTGKNIYVPKGNYYVSDTIVLSDRILRGSEPGKTGIYGTMADKKAPIVLAEGCSSVYDIAIYYPTKEECYGAAEGEKVALQVGTAEKPLSEGSVIKSLYLQYNGTSVYSPADAGCSGVLFENIEIKYFQYRGFDMQCENRFMNSYSNCYITSFNQDLPAAEVDCGFALEGSSYGETINQLNVEHDTYNIPVIFSNAKNLNVSVMHLEGVNLKGNNMGWIYCENTSGYIGALTVYFTYIDTMNNSTIHFGDSSSKDALIIGVLHQRGLNGPDTNSHQDWIAEIAERGLEKGMNPGGDTAHSYKIFRRDSDATGEYSVNVDYYTYYYYAAGDTPYYTNFGSDSNLTVTVNNEVKEATK